MWAKGEKMIGPWGTISKHHSLLNGENAWKKSFHITKQQPLTISLKNKKHRRNGRSSHLDETFGKPGPSSFIPVLPVTLSWIHISNRWFLCAQSFFTWSYYPPAANWLAQWNVSKYFAYHTTAEPQWQVVDRMLHHFARLPPIALPHFEVYLLFLEILFRSNHLTSSERIHFCSLIINEIIGQKNLTKINAH